MKPRDLTMCGDGAAGAGVAPQETQASRPHFDVASLKPNNGCETIPRAGNLSPSSGRLDMHHARQVDQQRRFVQEGIQVAGTVHARFPRLIPQKIQSL